MNDFLNYIMDNFPEFVTAIVSVFTALVSLLMLIISKAKIKNELEIQKTKLKTAQLNSVTTKCPECGSKVYLKDLHFYLPDGSQDDDLDGDPD